MCLCVSLYGFYWGIGLHTRTLHVSLIADAADPRELKQDHQAISPPSTKVAPRVALRARLEFIARITITWLSMLASYPAHPHLSLLPGIILSCA